ncbi:oligosaccharide flippase family protein [Anaeromyxobacter paludicola]|uniref:Polysaccharide biosynthesis protein n=1 Tax=Anaeromyxobacter paludicola TaxID=2918171 RepID=A0ABM7XCQ8_9BACT|nr:oligosaccharide flippase family protein [Anaeromyxobacter paludicola]BDG09650.1 hypothetical protein AMPC_27630 [Anaeromyxobacter paludicola]
MAQPADPAAPDTGLSGRFRASVLSYGARQLAVMALGLGSSLVLTRFLSPAEFGRVAVISVVTQLALLLADGGLGVYLVQRPEEVTDRDLARVTGLQLRLAGAIVLLCAVGAGVAFALAPGQRLGWMVAAAALSLPLLVVRGMSLLRLERGLRLDRVVRVEILEEAVYAAVAVAAAARGAGAWSVVLAQLARAVAGASAAAAIGRFRLPRGPVGWDEELARGVRFGLHFQSAQLINLARVAVVPLYIVPVLGLAAAGLVERAWFVCGLPLAIISAVQQRTMFPYVARIQADREQVRRFAEDAVHASALLATLCYLPLVLFPRALVVGVLGPQWEPMLPLAGWLLAGNVAFGALPGPMYAVANGLGKAHLISRINLGVLVASWALIVGLTRAFGVVGVGMTGLLLWAGTLLLRRWLRAELGPFRFFRQMAAPLGALGVAWAAVEAAARLRGHGPEGLAGAAAASLLAGAVYLAVVVAVDRERVRALWSRFRGGAVR